MTTTHMNPLPRPVSTLTHECRPHHDARLLDARAYEYAQRRGVSTIYGLALPTAEALAYLKLRGATVKEADAGLCLYGVGGALSAVVKPLFANDGGGMWLYVVSDLVAAAKGA